MYICGSFHVQTPVEGGIRDIEPEESGGLIPRIIFLELRRMESFIELFILS
jgi:hypothetical protein